MSKKFLTDSFLYILGDGLNKLAVFLLIPVYTSVFSVEEFGMLEMIVIATALLTIIISFGSKTSFLRLIHEDGESKASVMLFNISLLIIFLFLFITVTTFLFQDFINDLAGMELTLFLYFIFGYSVFLGFNELSLVILRYDKKVITYVFFSFLKTMFEIGAILFFVLYLKTGVIGKVEGSLISAVAMFLILFKLVIWKNIEFNLDLSYLKVFFVYSTPIVFHQLIGWILVSYDKLILAQSFSIRDLGVFALGMQLLMIFKYFLEASLKALNVEIFSNPDIIKKYLFDIILLVISLSVIAGLSLILFADYLILLVANKNYLDSAMVLDYMTISRIVMIYNLILVMVLYLYKDSKAVLASTMKGFFVMLVSSAALIPQLHFLGAGVSALIVYSVIGYFLTKSVRRHVQFTMKTIISIVPIIFIVGILLSLMDVELQYKGLFIVVSAFLLIQINKKFILKVY